jgi:hypothetical protein
LLVLERDVELNGKVLAGLDRLFRTTLPKDVLDDLVRLAPKDTLPEFLGFLGSLDRAAANELAALEYLGPLSRSPRVLKFIKEPGNFDALRRIVRAVGSGHPTPASVESAISSLESIIEKNPAMTAREIEDAATPARKPKPGAIREDEPSSRQPVSGPAKKETTPPAERKPPKPDVEAKKKQPVKPPIQRDFVGEYNRAVERARNARNDVAVYKGRLQSLREAGFGEQGREIAEAKEDLKVAEELKSNLETQEQLAEQALRESTLELHEKLGAIARNRKEYLDIIRLADGKDMVGNFKVEPPDTVHPDHIVAIRRLAGGDPKFSDFLKLRFDDMVEIANLRE